MLALMMPLIMSNLNAQEHQVKFKKNFGIVTVRSFLVTKPMSDEFRPESGGEVKYGFDHDFLVSIGGEANPDIVAGKPFTTPDGKQNSFTPHSWDDDYIDLTKLFGRPSNVFTYLYTEIESSFEGEAFLHIGSNDGVKVWFNGKMVIGYKARNGRSAEKSQNVVKVDIKKGRNTILLKVDQLGGGWGAYVQIYSAKENDRYANRVKYMQEKSAKVATILETRSICKEPDRYIGWPTITRTSSGELIAVFSGDRDEHICPWGKTQMIRSRDNGKTWTEPVTINNTPLDDRDAGIVETKNGTLVVSWFTSMAFDSPSSYARNPGWKRHREKLSKETVDRWLGNWIRRSVDGGRTWEEPVRVLGTAPHGPIVLKDGRLMLVGIADVDDEKVLSVEVSEDEGKTWKMISSVPMAEEDEPGPYSEPHVAELPDGKLIAMFRYQPRDRSQAYLRQSESIDGGKTWTVTHKTNIWGYPPHLLVLDDGRLLVTYGVRRIPYGERACISSDGGKTWDIGNEIILTVTDNDDLGYPASVQLDDGSIITIFYQIDKPGEKTSLMMTHWKLK